MLDIISKSTCTTHQVQDESKSIQMLIFQNNRGKRPTNLEIVKAQFMYNVHLYGNNDKDALIGEIKDRFEGIYKSISSIEYHINEDDVLLGQVLFLVEIMEACGFNQQPLRLGSLYRVSSPS